MSRAAGSPRWLLGFLLFEMACQLGLLIPGIGAARVFMRSAAFAGSLAALLFFPGSGRRHPASLPIGLGIAVLALEFFHPTTNNVISGLAEIGLNLAVVAPLIWVPRIDVDRSLLRWMLLALWAYNTMSAIFGLLQVVYPGQFQPNLSTALSDEYAAQLTITLANGEQTFRPMGLTDTPGGAGIGGFYAVLLGMGFLMSGSRSWAKPLFVGGMLVGMVSLYMCQVRALMVTLAACAVGMGIVFALQRRVARLTTFGVSFIAVLLVGFLLAAKIGGDSVTNRLGSLFESGASDVYYSSRGIFLEQTFRDLLPEYPFGAGLGRWGMIASYFADISLRDRAPVHVEIQWTGWLLDGGVPFMLTYVAAIGVAIKFALDVARKRVGAHVDELWLWGVLIFGYDIGALSLTFSYPLFAGNMGLEFWLLNASVFAASRVATESPTR